MILTLEAYDKEKGIKVKIGIKRYRLDFYFWQLVLFPSN